MPQRVWAIIPARIGSVRLPRKPLLAIDGRPLIVHVIERVVASGVAEEVVVATDDQEVEQVVRGSGFGVVRTGAALSGTHRCFDAARRMGGTAPDVVVNVQGDQPLVAPEQLQAVVEGAWDVQTLATPTSGDPSDPRRVKVVVGEDGRALYFSRSPVPYGGPYLTHVGIYAFRWEALGRCASAPRCRLAVGEDLEQLAWLEAKVPIHVRQIAHSEAPVDDEADLERVRQSFWGSRLSAG